MKTRRIFSGFATACLIGTFAIATPALAASRMQSTTTLSVSGNPSDCGQAMSLTASVTARQPVSGAVTFYVSAPVGVASVRVLKRVVLLHGNAPIALGTVTVRGGLAELTIVPHCNLPLNSDGSPKNGSLTLTAKYGGNQHFTPSQSSLTQTIVPAPTVVDVNDFAPYGLFECGITTPYNDSTYSSPNFTGVFTITEGATVLGTGPYSGEWMLGQVRVDPLVAFSPGSHTVTCSYSGDPSYAPSVSAPYTYDGYQPISTVTTLQSVNPGSSTYGEDVVFNYSVSPTTNGTCGWLDSGGDVNLMEGSTIIVADAAGGFGNEQLDTSTLSVGTHTLTLVYSGIGCFLPSASAPFTFTVT